MSQPTVSVIMPFHNAESTIEAAVRSLQNQTSKNWEAILVDDGSTDASSSIARQFASRDSRLKSITQEKAGVSTARNKGIEICRGKYVHFLDADDVLASTMLEALLGELEGKGLDAVCCGWIMADRNLQNLNWRCAPPTEGYLFSSLAHENLFPLHCAIVTRNLVESVGGFDPTLNQCEDWDLWVRVSRTGIAFTSVPEPLAIYRMQPVSNSRNAQANFAAGEQVIHRAHSIDVRVPSVSNAFYQGCQCSRQDAALLEWLLVCIAFAIAKRDRSEIENLAGKIPANLAEQLSPLLTRSMGYALWVATAIPHGDWEPFCKQVGEPLIEFLLLLERRSGLSGFALQSVLQIIGWHDLQRKPALPKSEEVNFAAIDGALLLRALAKKAANRIARVVGGVQGKPNNKFRA